MTAQFSQHITSPKLLSEIRAVAFDCYGTLLFLGERMSPYREMLEMLKLSSVERAHWVQLIMTRYIGLLNVPRLAGRSLTLDQVSSLKFRLDIEIISTQLFDEVLDVLSALRERGLKLALISNSAEEYRFMSTYYMHGLFDIELWSFHVGFMKPDPNIYSLLCEKLSMPPEQILMVGDRLEDDVIGARRAGLKAQLLDRRTSGAVPGSIQNLREILQ